MHTKPAGVTLIAFLIHFPRNGIMPACIISITCRFLGVCVSPTYDSTGIFGASPHSTWIHLQCFSDWTCRATELWADSSLFIFTIICCPQLFSLELKIKHDIYIFFFSFLKVQLVCGSLKQEVDTEEAEAASFDKAECCHHNANSRMQSAKKHRLTLFCRLALMLFSV